MATKTSPSQTSTWTFLTNHAHVLMCMVKQPDLTMREIADLVGITERAVQRIVADLRKEQFISLQKEGRKNTYKVNSDQHLKHPIEAHRRLKDLVKLIHR